jgi:hypothetical protein
MRRSTVIWFLIATCVGVALFLLKYEVQNKEDQLATLHRGILADQEAIHVLEAEWSYLNRPDRLEALVRRHLDLVPLEERRLGALEALPMRLPDFEADEAEIRITEEELIAANLPPFPELRPRLGAPRASGGIMAVRSAPILQQGPVGPRVSSVVLTSGTGAQ